MNGVGLERVAREVIPPVGASMACCLVDGAGKHRAAFVIDGRLKSAPVGPAFDRPRDAIRLVAFINGEHPASRSAPQPDPAVDAVGVVDESGDAVAAPSGTPGVSEAPRRLARGPVRSIPPERLSAT